MPSNQTANYALSQWERTDQVKMDDFNADNVKLDAALKAEADARTAETAALTEAVSKLGNCRVETFTFVGTGTQGKSITFYLDFPARPVLFFILGNPVVYVSSVDFHLYLGNRHTATSNELVLRSTGFEWTGNQAKIIIDSDLDQLALSRQTYQVIAFYPKDGQVESA